MIKQKHRKYRNLNASEYQVLAVLLLATWGSHSNVNGLTGFFPPFWQLDVGMETLEGTQLQLEFKP